MTTPAGSPIWDRAAAAATYGGHANLRDYGNIGSVNANTDVNAAQYQRLCADVAAMALTAPICTMILTWSSVSGATVTSIICPWAPQITSSYVGTSPPSALYPTVTLDSTSRFWIELPETAEDEFGVSASLIIRFLQPTISSVTTRPYWEGPRGDNVAYVANLPSSATCQLVIW